MRRLVVGMGIAFSLASAVPAVAHEPPFSWTGFYVGVNAGYSWGKADTDASATVVIDGTPFEASGSRSANLNGALGGGQLATIGNHSAGSTASRPTSKGPERTA